MARRAGVSVGSVSRVINCAPGLRAETELRVRKAIADLGFQPSRAAQSLRSQSGSGPRFSDAMNLPRLVSVGSLSLDDFVRVARLPSPGERLQTSEIEYFIGGPGAIVAVSASRLGSPFDLRVDLGSVVGEDKESVEAVDRLMATGVGATSIVRDRSCRLPRAIVLVEPCGRRTILGERVTQIPPGLKLRLERFAGQPAPTVFHIEGHYIDHCRDFARQMSGAGQILTMDTTGLAAAHLSMDGLAALTEVYRMIFVSGGTARRLVACRADADLPEAFSEALARQKWAPTCRVVLHLGPAGSALLDRDGTILRAPALAVQPVDVTGAGDVFVGVFLAVWMTADSLTDALRYATTAAGLSTLSLGVNTLDLTASRIAAAMSSGGMADLPQSPGPRVTISG